MRLRSLHLLTIFLVFATVDSGQEIWAFEPAQRNVSFANGIEIAGPISGNVIKVVGSVATVGRRRLAVLSFGIPRLTNDGDHHELKRASNVAEIPSDAIWPNADGTINSFPRNGGALAGVAQSRNPWERRVAKRPHEETAIFSCGGAIVGGSGGNIAILNGRIVRRSDIVGEFRVATILAAGVVLDRNGSLFVIPLGRRVTIENNEH